jgi:hypothetical protein
MKKIEIVQYFSTLNIFYLKLYQYEKYILVNEYTQIINVINNELGSLKRIYEKELCLSKLTVEEMINNCKIQLLIYQTDSILKVENQLDMDLEIIKSISLRC